MQFTMKPAVISVFLVASLIKGGLSVEIAVQSQVIVQLPAKRATLQCNFTLSDSKKLFKIIWRKEDPDSGLVLNRESSDKIYSNMIFNSTPCLGKGCSLVLPNPLTEHSGNYSVLVHVAGEKNYGQGTVQLIVLNNRPTGPNTSDTTTLFHPDKDTSADEGNTSWIWAVVVVAVAILCFGAFVIYWRKSGQNRCRQWKETQRKRAQEKLRKVVFIKETNSARIEKHAGGQTPKVAETKALVNGSS